MSSTPDDKKPVVTVIPAGISSRSGTAPPMHTRFKPGVSANPGGRTPKAARLARAIAAKASPALMRQLLAISWNEKAALKDRISAITKLLEYGIGKAVLPIELSGTGGGPVQIAADAFAVMPLDELERRRAALVAMHTAIEAVTVVPTEVDVVPDPVKP